MMFPRIGSTTGVFRSCNHKLRVMRITAPVKQISGNGGQGFRKCNRCERTAVHKSRHSNGHHSLRYHNALQLRMGIKGLHPNLRDSLILNMIQNHQILRLPHITGNLQRSVLQFPVLVPLILRITAHIPDGIGNRILRPNGSLRRMDFQSGITV